MEQVSDFLNPKSMLTPGLAGAITMTISNSLFNAFGLPPAWSGLGVSLLFGLLAVAAATIPRWQKAVYCVLNALVIFSVAIGTNTMGQVASRPAAVGPSALSFPFPVFPPVAEALAQPAPPADLIKGSGPQTFLVVSGHRRFIPDLETFSALGLRREEIRTIPDAEVRAIPEGPAYPHLPGSLVKGRGREIFQLRRGYKHLIPDNATFEAMGLRWNDVVFIPDEDLQAIPTGDPLEASKKFFNPWFKK